MKEQLYENFGGTRTATSRMFRRIRTLEWLALMQHYGAPTRLLDFTYSFWIALFFAFEEAENDCSVVALDPSSSATKKEKISTRFFRRILKTQPILTISSTQTCRSSQMSDSLFRKAFSSFH